VYFQNNGWMRSTVLPSIFINVNPVEEQKHELEFKNDSINEIEQENEEHIKNYPIHH